MENRFVVLTFLLITKTILVFCGNVTQVPQLRVARQIRPISSTHCVLRINEINTDSNNAVPSLFIELRRLCVDGRKTRRSNVKSLTGYYLIIIRAEPPAVVLFADLQDKHLNADFIFTMGDSSVPNIDLDIAHGNVQSIYKNDPERPSIPSGVDSPYAILLIDTTLASKISRFRLVKASNTHFLEKPVTSDDIMYILQEEDNADLTNQPPFLLDMVVYGSLKTPATSCSLFDPLFRPSTPVEGGKKYLLRDWDAKQQINIGDQLVDISDYSLNRCTESTAAFTPTAFQYDKPTPGKPNLCQGAAFFLEDIINKVSDINVVPMEVDQACSAEDPQVPAGRYPLVQESAFAQIREAFCSDTSNTYSSQIGISDEAMDIAISQGEISDSGGTPEAFTIGTSSWNDAWIDTAKPYFASDGIILHNKDVQDWLRIQIPGSTTPISFNCAACLQFFEDGMGNVLRKSNIMTPSGYFNERPEINRAQLRKHMRDDVHISAINYQYQLQAAKTDEQKEAIKKAMEDKYDEKLLPTAKMVRTVFAEIIAETPFIYHEVFVNLQKTNGVDLGEHQYHTKAAIEITSTISQTMHYLLINHLKDKNLPFSLIVDSSTTKRNIPLFIIYIQTLEDGYPVTYYYKILELVHGASAEETFNTFWRSVEADDELVAGFKDFFTSKLAFFVSDSASVMVGIRNSFYTRLRDKTPSRSLGQIGCMAHKMALVIKQAVRGKDSDSEFAYIRTFERSINGFYGFYSARGSKRFQHLAETAEKYEINVFRLRKNIEVRWAAAEYEVIDNILKDWEALEKDLDDIRKDDENFNKNAQDQAYVLHENLLDVANLVLYHEFVDFLGINMVVSKALQSRASILADHAELISNSLTQYHLLQTEYGDRLKEFLSEVTCPNVCVKSTCSLENVENCANPEYKGITLKHNPTVKVYNMREKLYGKLFDAMNHYFEYEKIEAMKFFDHRLNKDIPEKELFRSGFTIICETYAIGNWEVPGLTCENLFEKIFDFVIDAMSSTKFKQYFGRPDELPPSQFWPMLLQPDSVIKVDPLVTLFFQYLLVHGDSSAEAERGFSFVNRIASDARSGMKAVTLDSILRIKLNANKPIEDLKAFLYAKEFAKTHFLVDSPIRRVSKPTKKQSAYCERVSRLF